MNYDFASGSLYVTRSSLRTQSPKYTMSSVRAPRNCNVGRLTKHPIPEVSKKRSSSLPQKIEELWSTGICSGYYMCPDKDQETT